MRLASPRVISLAMAAACTAASAAAGEKYALVIGLNRYGNEGMGITRLAYAEKDVRELTGALQALGYTELMVLVDDDAKRRDILRELHRLAAKIQPDDTFLLYFAGHGVRGDNQATYWLTYDASLELLDEAGIRLEHLLDYVRDIKARQKLVLLDHCYSGDVVPAVSAAASPAATTGLDVTAPTGPPSASSPRAGTRGVELQDRGLTPVELTRGIEQRAAGLVVLAAARGPAYEVKALEHGAFTAALLEALRSRKASGDDHLTALELVGFVKRRVKDLTNQEPSDVVAAQNIASWEVARGLKPDDAGQARAKMQAYFDKLEVWQSMRGWIDLETKIESRAILNKWARSFEGGPALSPAEDRKFVEIKNHLELRTPTSELEEECAKDLMQALKRLANL
jgi:uncharacterized caspase-like protein